MSSYIPRSDEEARRMAWDAVRETLMRGEYVITMEGLVKIENPVDPLLAYHRHLETICADDVAYVRRKDAQYSASWKRRGGAGAFFTMARPWDRLESIARSGQARGAPAIFSAYDVFAIIEAEGLQGPDGSLVACVRDLRRYLLLLEAEMTERKLAADAAHNSPDRVDWPGEPLSIHKADFADVERRVLDRLNEIASEKPHRSGTPEEKALDFAAAYSGDSFAESYRAGTPDDGGHHEPRDELPLETVRGIERMVPRRPPATATLEEIEREMQSVNKKDARPWVVGPGYTCKLGSPSLWDAWRRVTNDVYVLEQRLDPELWHALPEEVQRCFSPVYAHPRRVGDDVIPSWSDHRPAHVDADTLVEPTSYWLKVEDAPEDERVRWTTYPEEQNMKEAESLMEAIELYEWVSSKFRYILRDARRAWLPQ